MNIFAIGNFWDHRVEGSVRNGTAALIQGWSFQIHGLETLREVPLTLSDELGTRDDPAESSLLLASAPGAVSKTTLAKQIAFSTDSVYIDLSEAAPVGANRLIDGVDEARLKVTEEAFDAFVGLPLLWRQRHP